MTKVRCSSCSGKGEVPSGHATLYGTLAYRVCDGCLGLGFDYHYDCEACMDTGVADVVDGQPVSCLGCEVGRQRALDRMLGQPPVAGAASAA